MKKQILTVCVAAVLLALGSGCAAVVLGGAAAAGAGGYAYVKGESKYTEGASLDRTYNATLAAMKDLEFPVTSKSKDMIQASVTAKNASNKTITVHLKKLSDSATEVGVRVGAFGDETLSHAIIQKIKSHL